MKVSATMNNETEVWKDVKGYEGLYQVSNLGNVKSLYGLCGRKYVKREKILKKTVHLAYGNYYREVVTLRKDKKKKEFKVHRLVAEAFLPNLENKPMVNHIDGNPLNNRIDNLEWCTNRENIIHAYETGLMGRYIPSKEELEELYVNKRTPITKIAKEKNMSVDRVKKYLNRYGIKIRNQSEATTKLFITKEFLEKELKHKTQVQIAKEIGCNVRTIRKYKKKFNL